MAGEESICAACGEPGRLHCADCDRIFCVDHLERHFAMGYFFLCPACTAQRQAASAPKRRRSKAPRA